MRFLAGWSLCALAAGSACAQSVISTHSGVVQYVEGRAFIADKPVDPKFGQFPDIKRDQEFRTEDGRAEILLTPGVFLRLGENSSIRMLSTQLTDTRVEVLTGSAIVESTEIPKDNAVELIYKNESIRLEKQGIYRLDTNPARFETFEGEAVVSDPSGQLTLKNGKQSNLGSVLMAESFDRKADDQDSLYRWSDRRASYVAQANVASATAAGTSNGGYGYTGLNYGGLGSYGFGYNPAFLGGWAFNPMFGMYTYLPYGGFGYSPFGYTYYSPYTVGYAPLYGSGYTYGSGPGRVAGVSAISRMAAVASRPSLGAGLRASARSYGSGGASVAASGSGSASVGHAASIGGGGHAGGGHR